MNFKWIANEILSIFGQLAVNSLPIQSSKCIPPAKSIIEETAAANVDAVNTDSAFLTDVPGIQHPVLLDRIAFSTVQAVAGKSIHHNFLQEAVLLDQDSSNANTTFPKADVTEVRFIEKSTDKGAKKLAQEAKDNMSNTSNDKGMVTLALIYAQIRS